MLPERPRIVLAVLAIHCLGNSQCGQARDSLGHPHVKGSSTRTSAEYGGLTSKSHEYLLQCLHIYDLGQSLDFRGEQQWPSTPGRLVVPARRNWHASTQHIATLEEEVQGKGQARRREEALRFCRMMGDMSGES